MLKVALRGLLARRVRLALTAAAVALGVTLIAGTYVFTDTIDRSFDKIFSNSYAGIDVAVTPPEGVESDTDEGPPLPAALVRQIRAVPGVAQVEGAIFTQGVILDGEGKRLTSAGPPSFISSVSTVKAFNTLTPVEGRLPSAMGEGVIDKGTADRKGFEVGDRISAQGDGPRTPIRLTGIVRFAGVDNYGGASLLAVTMPQAQAIAGRGDAFNEIDVQAADGTNADALARAVQARVGDRAVARTGAAEANAQTEDIRDDFSFLRTALLAFAGISLFVGAFLIFNTFSITVAQRTREFALLRTLGASRRQVLGSVLAEGLLLGVLGSAIGLALGVLTAKALQALFKAVGADLPSTGSVIETRTIVVSLVVGLLVTLAATLAPALRATRVPPVAALREGVTIEARRSRVAPIAGAVLAVLGTALLAVGLFAVEDETGALSLMGAGAAAAFIGVALLSPRLVPPLSQVVGRPMLALGMPGRLARENATRQPGRTAVTAAALMIGVALVTFASIFAGSFKSYIADSIDTGSKAQAVIQNGDGFSPFTHQATEAVAQVDGVAQVSPVRFVNAELDGTETDVTGIDPRTFSEAFNVEWDQGDDALLTRLGSSGAIVSKGYAEDHDLRVGSPLTLRTESDQRVTLRVEGIHDDATSLLGDVVVPNATVERGWATTKDSFVLVDYAPGADPKPQVDRLLEDRFPIAEALTTDEFKDDQAGQIDQLLYMVYALLSLAIIVSLFGIVNTLYLSITERTRELGLLRAVGTTRRQVKRMVRAEAVITALIGSVLGLVVGGVLALLVSRAVDDLPLTIPVATMVVVLVVGGLAGVAAAAWPARRAARLDVLDALAYE